MSLTCRTGNHRFFKRYIIDPLVALCVAFLVLIFKILPVSLARRLGESLGSLVYLLAARRNHIAMINLSLAFPDKTERQKKEIIKKMWRHFGGVFAEMPHAATFLDRTDIVGEKYFQQAKNATTGGFLCSAHFGNWELVNSSYKKGLPLNLVYRKANNPWLEKLLFKRRVGTLIPKGAEGARLMIKVLRDKQFVGMLCDQKLREGIWVPFFGKPAQTASAIATLSLKMNLPIFMVRCLRQKNGRFQATFYPPLSIEKTGDLEKDTFNIMLKINQTFENWITQNPEQWLWIHRRFPKEFYSKKLPT